MREGEGLLVQGGVGVSSTRGKNDSPGAKGIVRCASWLIGR